MRTSYFLLFASILCCSSCIIDNRNDNLRVNTWVPVYAQTSEIDQIGVTAPASTVTAGKIYAYGNYIFQNDVFKGFHIINNSGATAQKIAFLKVPFSTEIAIRSNYLYTNNVSDLVIFDISNPLKPVLVNRVKNAFPVIDQLYPPVTNTYFECPDTKKGIVVRWEQKMIDRPNCRR